MSEREESEKQLREAARTYIQHWNKKSTQALNSAMTRALSAGMSHVELDEIISEEAEKARNRWRQKDER